MIKNCHVAEEEILLVIITTFYGVEPFFTCHAGGPHITSSCGPHLFVRVCPTELHVLLDKRESTAQLVGTIFHLSSSNHPLSYSSYFPPILF